jgi:hypothetical protein
MNIEQQIIKRQDEITQLKDEIIQTLREQIEEHKKYEVHLKKLIELQEKILNRQI